MMNMFYALLLSLLMTISVFAVVSTICNIKYILKLRTVSKAIKNGKVKVVPLETFDIDGYGLTMDKKVTIATVSAEHKSFILNASIRPDIDRIVITMSSKDNTDMDKFVMGRMYYLETPMPLSFIDSILYKPYAKRVEAYLETATSAMRI